MVRAPLPATAGTYAITADFTPGDTTDYTSLTGAAAGNFVIGQALLSPAVMLNDKVYDGTWRRRRLRRGSWAGSITATT